MNAHSLEEFDHSNDNESFSEEMDLSDANESFSEVKVKEDISLEKELSNDDINLNISSRSISLV